MDIKKVESVAVPTALAATGAGVAGYLIPRTITKNAELSNDFVKFLSLRAELKDVNKMIEADTLDTIGSALPTEEEVKALGTKNFREKFFKLLETKTKNNNKAIENFVVRNSSELGIEPKKGQTLKDAAREYIKGKSIEEIKEAFLPSSMRRAMENTDYQQLYKDMFADAYDSTAKKFKKGEEFDEIAKMFKRSGRQMRACVGGTWAAVAGTIALASSVIATKIANK